MSNDASKKLLQIKQYRTKLPDHVISAAADKLCEILGGIDVILDHYLSNARYLKPTQINALHEFFQHQQHKHTQQNMAKQKTRHKRSATSAISSHRERNSILSQSTTSLSLLDGGTLHTSNHRSYDTSEYNKNDADVASKSAAHKENLYMSQFASPELASTPRSNNSGGIQERLRREREKLQKKQQASSKTAPNTPDLRSSTGRSAQVKLNRINSRIEEMQHTRSKSLYSRGVLKPRPKSAKVAAGKNILSTDKLDTMRSMTTFFDCADLSTGDDDEKETRHRSQTQTRRVQFLSHLQQTQTTSIQFQSQPNLHSSSQLQPQGQSRKLLVKVGDVDEKITSDIMFDGSDYDRVTEDVQRRNPISEYTKWDSDNHALQSENVNEYFNALTRKFRAKQSKKLSKKKNKPRFTTDHMPFNCDDDDEDEDEDGDENIPHAVSERSYMSKVRSVRKESASASDVLSKIMDVNFNDDDHGVNDGDGDGDDDEGDGDEGEGDVLHQLDQNTNVPRHTHHDKSNSTMESPDFLAYFDRFMKANSSFYALEKLGANE